MYKGFLLGQQLKIGFVPETDWPDKIHVFLKFQDIG
jgi:hypothetical protein